MDSGDCETEEDSAPEACVSPEGGPLLPSNSREMRNRAEKMRRDKLNSFITELAALVPMVSRSSKRMDKTSILRLTASHLRIYQTLLGNGSGKKPINIPKNVDQCILEQLVFEQLNGFLVILTSTGKIVFTSYTVEQALGHLQTDLMGQSIFNVTAPEDHERLRMYLNQDPIAESEWRKYFNIRLKRAGPRTESAVFETVNLMGMQSPSCRSSSLSKTTFSNGREVATTSQGLNNDVSDDIWVFFARVIRPEPICTQLVEGSKEEYITRHLVDGRIINCDQRISIIAGYLIEEVTGLSAFKFMHKEDVRWVMIALRQMYDKGQSRGSSCYRLLSRTGQFIYLKTFGFLEIDSTGTVESFICINTLVPEREGESLIREMKHKYSALISYPSEAITSSETNSVEDPVRLEEAIAHLIDNLPSPESECSTPSPQTSSTCENQDCTPLTEFQCSPQAPQNSYRYKTTTKRPPSTDLGTSSKKRHKESNDKKQMMVTSHKRHSASEVMINQEHR